LPENSSLYTITDVREDDRDSTVKQQLIMIGESIHASIPETGRIMRALSSLGPDAYCVPSEQLRYIRALIESQVANGADYMAVNVDTFGESDARMAVDLMRAYVRMVREWGRDIPACIDSSNDDVLIAGLEQWHDTDQPVKQPLLNSVKIHTVDKVLPLKDDFDFALVGLLLGEKASAGLNVSNSVDQLYGLAKEIFQVAVGRYGFKSEEIFFDPMVFPLAIDMPMQAGVPGYTYRTFETIKRIRTDPQMRGVHCVLGISNCVRDLPGRKIGVCRAYLAKAMEYGLDAAIVNVAHRYGQVEPAPDLLELVDAYAKMDGSPERTCRAMELMGKFCRESRKPAK
jgi:cobalamin-dependent methionine synthase I